MVLLKFFDVPFQAGFEHLACKELDVNEGGHHIVADCSVEGLHHVHTLPLLLQLQVLRDVAH
jgi:hypothetical protein